MERNLRRIIGDLDDVPGEARAVAIADAVYGLANVSERAFAFYVTEADAILTRLREHGFDVVAAPQRAANQPTRIHAARIRAELRPDD